MGIPFRSPIQGPLPSNLKQRFDYTGGPTASDPVYIGYAKKGTSTSSAGWFIQKLTYSASVISQIDVAENAIWDSRATLLYA